MSLLTFTVHKTAEEDFYFHLRNIAGTILVTSRDYINLKKCLDDLYTLQVHDFTIEECSNMFTLMRYDGYVVGESGAYYSRNSMLQDIELIIQSIREADIEDRCTMVKFVRVERSQI